MGFALLAVLARWLTPAQNAAFLALWGLVFAFGSVLGSVEQEVARLASHATLDERRVPFQAPQTVAVTLVGATVACLVLVVSPPGRTLTDGSLVVVALTFVALGGFAAQVLARGVFLGRHAIGAYAGVLVAEAALRLLTAGLLVVGGADPSVALGVCAIVVGCFGWLPLVMVLANALDWHGPRADWRPVAGTVTALATATGLSALVLTGFPALATVVVGHVGELADLFAAITLSRVPLVLLAPVQALTIPVAIRWIRSGRIDLLHRSLWWTTLVGLLAAGLAALVGEGLGPGAVALFMGDQYHPSRLTCALVLGATCLVAAALLQAAVLVALQRYWVMAACWFLSVGVAAVIMWSPNEAADTRALWGFVAAAVVAQATTAVAAARAAARASSQHRTGVNTETTG
jgi:O-antigen/teichoic acid export membrane protein